MRWFICIIFISLVPLTVYAQSASEDAADRPPSPELPDDPLSTKAKEAYGAGQYNEASRKLFVLAQKYPENPAVYRSMARANSWAGDVGKAIVAYRYYIELAPDASDLEKVKAELALCLRRLGAKAPSKELPAAIQAAFSEVDVRSKAGKFTGKLGAFGALADIRKAGHISPGVAQARRSIRSALVEHSESALDRWWVTGSQAEVNTLTELAAGWEKAADIKALNGKDKQWAAAVDGLAHLASNEPARAAELLGPVAPGDKKLRYAQVVALVRIGRHKEAKVILDALVRGHADARVHLLHGFVLRKMKDEAAVESFMMALDNEDEL